MIRTLIATAARGHHRLLPLLGALLVGCSTATVIESETGQTYYTRANIWYEHPERIYSTNYHVGRVLPIGSRVEMIQVTTESITFSDETGTRYVIHFIPEYSGNFDSYFDACFSETSVLESKAWKSLSETEKKAVEKGRIAVGMSKPAVLMAYGMPPVHETPSTERNTWTYWINRFKTIQVEFDSEGTVSRIVK